MVDLLASLKAKVTPEEAQGSVAKPGTAYFRSSWATLRFYVKGYGAYTGPEVLFKDYGFTTDDPEVAEYVRKVAATATIYTINEVTADEYQLAVEQLHSPQLPPEAQGELEFEEFDENGQQKGSGLTKAELDEYLKNLNKPETEPNTGTDKV